MFRIDRRLVNPTEQPCASPEGERKQTPQAASVAEQTAQQQAFAAQQLEQLAKVGEEIVAQASLKANLLISEAEIEAQEIRSGAWQVGYTEGKAEAEAQYAEKRRQDEAAVLRLMGEFEQARRESIERLEQDVLDLTLSIARKIVGAAVLNDPAAFEYMIKNALTQIKRQGKVTIRVSEAEYGRFFASGTATFVIGDESVSATILNDPMLTDGGCIVETDVGTINCGTDSQLKYIEIAFRQTDVAT